MARSSKYKHPLSWYAEKYGKSLRTIKGLSARGVNLDDEKTLLAHLTANQGRHGDSSPSSPPSSPSDPVDLSSLNLPPEFFEARGLDAAIVRLSYLEQVTGRKVAEAIASNNPREIQNWIKAHDAITTQFRVSEKNSPAILKEKGSVVPLEEIRTDVSKLWTGIVSRLQGIPNRAMQTLVGLDAIDIQEELKKEIDQALEQLKEFMTSLQEGTGSQNA